MGDKRRNADGEYPTEQQGMSNFQVNGNGNDERLFSTTDGTDSTDGYGNGNGYGERRICYG
jgi:hypothetical protein